MLVTYTKSAMAVLLCVPGVMPPIKVNGKSNVVMRHGERPVCPMPGSTGNAPLHCGHLGGLGLSLSITYLILGV